MVTMFIVQAISSENPNLVYLKCDSAYDIAAKEGGFIVF